MLGAREPCARGSGQRDSTRKAPFALSALGAFPFIYPARKVPFAQSALGTFPFIYAAFAIATSLPKAVLSETARSARTLRSRMTEAFLRPAINLE